MPQVATLEPFAPTAVEGIERLILLIRGQKVMLDADLAALYGVETRIVVQAVRRNAERFPQDSCSSSRKKNSPL